ncbi:beta-glucosidase [Prevotella sp. khp1]|uniref:beta-glucosidase family protein n=1 Tax=Prevotellaceae TaxID=171552 RepID=UPI00088071AB|nr:MULTISPECIES: glycoside hydrolase family 3 N-terminal domain-containing protein [Prevotellaceae]QVJ79583.1 glycoside hydrolase family 3 C-terminal domain-containing protein [Xylanibacter ruminicola]SDQ33921.1 beta-glucosidase [Prevotella sp. khp1]
MKQSDGLIFKFSHFYIAAAALLLTACATADKQGPKNTINKEEVMSKLTLEDKAHFVIGTGMAGFSGNDAVIGATRSLVPGAAGTTYPLDSLGIPAVVLADGPAGLRIDAKRDNDSATYYCTHFPIGTLLASTWNTQLIEQVGQAIGEEVKEYGADVLLAPALNIMRNPLCGRNFEYYSEDPVVAGKTAAAYITGVQKNDVGTSIKHFAANNQETNRMNNDAHISQRALREIYLKGFEIAIKESKPWTVMTSYNYINGVYTSESKDLVTTILRDEWGYEGTVMTDWFGGKDGAKQMWAGNDMLQPGKAEQFDSIVAGVKSGKLSEADLDRSVKRILNLVEKSPRYQGYKYSNKPDLKAHAAVTRQSAAEGMVLMKNGGALPFAKTVKNVALYGNTSYDFIAGGTGSGNVNHAYVVSLLDGLKNGGYTVSDELKNAYAAYAAECKAKVEAEIAAAAKKDPKNAMLMRFMPRPLPAEKQFSADELTKQAAASDIAVITLGRISGEFMDRKAADFNLSDSERQLITQVCDVYHKAGKQVVVLLNIGGVIETASWNTLPDAILCAWQAGQEGGNSVVDVLSGKQSPSGKFTMTWPVKFTDAYSSKNFPVDQDPRIDMTNQGSKSANVKNVDYTDYEEDIYVGYRYFDSFDVPVSYPFGFGLSYTTFAYSDAKIVEKGNAYEVSVTVKNTGKHEGKEVVELYISAPDNQAANKPVKELKAYGKTKQLAPGESETITMTVQAADLASFDESASAWVVAAGEYQFLVGASSQDIKATLKANVKGQQTKVNNVLAPQTQLNLLKR